MTSPEILVNNDVLRWARESAGYSIEDISEKVRISSNTLKEWESKESKIRYATVAKIAKAVSRPTVALLLNNPPEEAPLPRYFRRAGEGPLAPEVKISIRKARHLQHISKELEANIDVSKGLSHGSASLNSDPEEIATRERTVLGITVATQYKWKDARKALEYFRNVIEKRGIFVFQMKMPSEHAQGFSLSDGAGEIIVLNNKDIPERRLFTLFHEYAHLVLGTAGVCLGVDIIDSSEEIERWCDAFAGAFLMPKADLVSIVSGKNIVTKSDLQSIAKSFSVSNHMTFVRLSKNHLLLPQAQVELSKLFIGTKVIETKVIKKESGKKVSGPPQHRRCISEKGKRFVSLVLENAKREQITTAKALEYLSVRLDNLPKVEAAVHR